VVRGLQATHEEVYKLYTVRPWSSWQPRLGRSCGRGRRLNALEKVCNAVLKLNLYTDTKSPSGPGPAGRRRTVKVKRETTLSKCFEVA
jgi:hypothetical protein